MLLDEVSQHATPDTIEFSDLNFRIKTAHAHSFYKIILFHSISTNCFAAVPFLSPCCKAPAIFTTHRIYGMFSAPSSLTSPVSLSLHYLPLADAVSCRSVLLDSVKRCTAPVSHSLNSPYLLNSVPGELPAEIPGEAGSSAIY